MSVMLLLSKLDDNTEIVNDERLHLVYTVAELKEEILNGVDHSKGQWWKIRRDKWRVSAKDVLNAYIESVGEDFLYEEWGEKVRECIKPELLENMQKLLDGAFDAPHITDYWNLTLKILIDVEKTIEK